MLLRRITQHVKDQNWFAVALDFFIVVIGVFMGFQVQQWSENRSEREDARQYLQRLVIDMDVAIERNNRQAKYALEQVEKSNTVLAALDSCELQKAEEAAFVTGLFSLGKTDMPIMVMGTIDELNSTGNFPLIGDLTLRRMVTESVRQHQTVLAIDNQIVGRTIPSINYVRSRVRFNLNKHYIDADVIDPADVVYKFEDLCADTEFIHAIATVREMTLANIAFNELRRDDQIQVKEALERELGGPVQAREVTQ